VPLSAKASILVPGTVPLIDAVLSETPGVSLLLQAMISEDESATAMKVTSFLYCKLQIFMIIFLTCVFKGCTDTILVSSNIVFDQDHEIDEIPVNTSNMLDR